MSNALGVDLDNQDLELVNYIEHLTREAAAEIQQARMQF